MLQLAATDQGGTAGPRWWWAAFMPAMIPPFSIDPWLIISWSGLGKKVFAGLIAALEDGNGGAPGDLPAGILRTGADTALVRPRLRNRAEDLVVERPPAYQLVSSYRPHYVLEKLGITMGFVASAYGCPTVVPSVPSAARPAAATWQNRLMRLSGISACWGRSRSSGWWTPILSAMSNGRRPWAAPCRNRD